MSTPADNWVADAEAALAGETRPGVEVLRGGRPPLFDAAFARAVVTPVMAALFWTAAAFREGIAGQPLDGLALFLRLLALAFSVRALFFLAQLGRRIGTFLRSGDHALALADGGLLLRTPKGDVAVARADVLDVVEPGRWGERSGRRWSEVYLVTEPASGRLHVALPPVFAATPGILAERLMRWRGPAPSTSRPTGDEAPPLVSKLWEELAAGARPAGIAVVPHGRGWIKRGPWATVLLGAAVLEGWWRLPAATTQAVGKTGPILSALCLVLIPLAWVLWTRRDLARRGGMALVLTPDAFMLRTRAGVQRFAWTQVGKVDLHARRTWSILEGAHPTRSILFEGKNAAPVVLDEATLALPAEVVQALADAYRKRASA